MLVKTLTTSFIEFTSSQKGQQEKAQCGPSHAKKCFKTNPFKQRSCLKPRAVLLTSPSFTSIDRMISEMSFWSFNIRSSELLLLVPPIICHRHYRKLDTGHLMEQYTEELPNPGIIDLKLKLEKKVVGRTDRKLSVQLGKSYQHNFPNVFVLSISKCTLLCQQSVNAVFQLWGD